MKLYEVLVTEKKKKGDQSPVKTRPVLVVETTIPGAKGKVKKYWGDDYSVGTPNMIQDFNPK